jgi:hypothetical protein
MARTSFKTYRRYLGLPGSPVEWTDRYLLSDVPWLSRPQAPDPLGFAHYQHLIADITPPYQVAPPGSTAFPTAYVRRSQAMMFNIADYGHTLMNDFLTAGGKFRHMEFHAPAEIGDLMEKVVINCPGYGARALWNDRSITPVRGQIAWLVPQPEVDYGFIYNDVSVLPRRDGIVVQAIDGGDMKGYGDDNEAPDPAEADRALATVAELYSRFRS